jgi:hypothetical protein
MPWIAANHKKEHGASMSMMPICAYDDLLILICHAEVRILPPQPANFKALRHSKSSKESSGKQRVST